MQERSRKCVYFECLCLELSYWYSEPISLAKASQMAESKLKEQKDDKEHPGGSKKLELKTQSIKSIYYRQLLCHVLPMGCSYLRFPQIHKINFILFNNEDTEVEGFSMTYHQAPFQRFNWNFKPGLSIWQFCAFSDYSKLNFFPKPSYCSALCKCLLLIKDNQRQTL